MQKLRIKRQSNCIRSSIRSTWDNQLSKDLWFKASADERLGI